MTTIARITRTVAGVPQDPDSVTLDDGAGVAIRRISDGAAILLTANAGVPVMQGGNSGVVTYDYTAHNLDPSSSYTIYFRFVRTTPPAVPTVSVPETIQAADDSRTLRGLRRALFRSGRIGPWSLHTTSELPTGTDAPATLKAASLADADFRPATFDGVYALLVSGNLKGQQRRARKNGLVQSTGLLLVSRAFSAAVPAGTDFELCHRLAAIEQDGASGIREQLNRALRVLSFPHRLTLAGVTGQYHYGVSQFPWLSREERLGRIFGPLTSSADNPVEWSGGVRWRADAAVPQLEIGVPFVTGQSFTVEVMRPAYSYIGSGGAFGSSTVGLVSDDDEIAQELEPVMVLEAALAYCYEALSGLVAAPEEDRWAEKAARQHLKAAKLKADLLEKLGAADPRPRYTTTLRSSGLGRRRWA